MTVGALEKGAKSSFDIRGTKLAKGLGGITKSVGGITGQSGLSLGSLGTASKSSFSKREAEAIKARTAYASSLKGRTTKTTDEERQIAEAEAARAETETARGSAKAEQETVSQTHEANKAEVARLEEEKKKDRYWDANPENAKNLEAAQQTVVSSDAALEAANVKLAEAEEHLAAQTAAASKTKTSVEAALEPRAAAKAAQQRYGQSLQDNAFMSSVFFGPGAKAAGENIVKNAGKLKEKAHEDLLKKWLKKYAEEEEGGGKTEAPTPVAPNKP
jgi:hypothetical protein